MEMAEIYFDGSSKPNPGKMKIGAVVKFGDRQVMLSKEMGEGTNNMAEYLALLEALKVALEMGAKKVKIFGDSTLVVEQLSGNYRVRSSKLKPIYEEVKRLLSKFEDWSIEWIPEEYNSEAHNLSQ